MELEGVDPYTWRRIIRRARLGASVKLVAYVLADYASPDGRDVRPGNPRLEATSELSDKTVRRSLERLRELGLIERVFVGSRMGRRGLADVYRLTIPADLPERVDLLPPDEDPATPVALAGVHSGRPVTMTGVQDGSPVTSTGHAGSVRDGTPVNDHRTPVTSSANTGHQFRPPNQAPNHLSPTNKTSGFGSHVAELEDAPDERAPAELDAFEVARGILSGLPDSGAEYVLAATEEMPGAEMRELVIRAAKIAAERS